jgi:hypothetical protein
MRKKWGKDINIIINFFIMESRNYQIRDLTLTEQKEVNGGILWEALLVAAFVAVIGDWDNFKAGLAGKPEIAK